MQRILNRQYHEENQRWENELLRKKNALEELDQAKKTIEQTKAALHRELATRTQDLMGELDQAKQTIEQMKAAFHGELAIRIQELQNTNVRLMTENTNLIRQLQESQALVDQLVNESLYPPPAAGRKRTRTTVVDDDDVDDGIPAVLMISPERLIAAELERIRQHQHCVICHDAPEARGHWCANCGMRTCLTCSYQRATHCNSEPVHFHDGAVRALLMNERPCVACALDHSNFMHFYSDDSYKNWISITESKTLLEKLTGQVNPEALQPTYPVQQPMPFNVYEPARPDLKTGMDLPSHAQTHRRPVAVRPPATPAVRARAIMRM